MTPPDDHHQPPDRPLRIHVEGPAVVIERLSPHIWNVEDGKRTYSQRAGPELARLTFRALFWRDVRPDVADDMVIRNECLDWMKQKSPGATREIGYYSVTFDHLVPADDIMPKLFQLNIMEVENDGVTYANEWLWCPVDPAEYIGKKVLAVPRWCQNRKSSQYRWSLNPCFDESFYGRG
ncbi:hypothetical protein N7488_007360 [Penicillium malachiteum]|nr:hypothetical protein N7488_007360 [Penicillium malachiteum]